MSRYVPPKIYYQTSLDANTSVEIKRFKSLNWKNKTNNNASFTLVLPIGEIETINPEFLHYIRLEPSDTIMKIEKRSKINDEKGNLWWEISGRPRQGTDSQVREAQNYKKHFRYLYNGIDDNAFVWAQRKQNPDATIGNSDIISSSFYEDNLGGYTEMVTEEFSWGTIVESTPIITRRTVTKQATEIFRVPDNAISNPGKEIAINYGTYSTDETETTGASMQVRVGDAKGVGGYMAWKLVSINWIKGSTSESITLRPNPASIFWQTSQASYSYYPSNKQVSEITYSMLTDAEARSQLTLQGAKGTIPATYLTVAPGHEGYNAIIKSKGNVNTRYWWDYKVGDTVLVTDLSLGIQFQDVVSGVVEVMDSNGYSIDLELGTLGATVEQRLSRVI